MTRHGLSFQRAEGLLRGADALEEHEIVDDCHGVSYRRGLAFRLDPGQTPTGRWGRTPYCPLPV